MRNIVLNITESRQWDGYYSSQGDEDMLFVPADDPVPVGTLVRDIERAFHRGQLEDQFIAD